MSETREQFRDRIGDKAQAAYDAAPGWVSHSEAVRNAAEAVYAEALRDLLQRFIAHPVASGFKDIVGAEPIAAAELLIESIQQFAAERGIGLGDPEARP